MKLSEKITELIEIRSLVNKRAAAVRALKDLEASEIVNVGGDYHTTEIPEGEGRAFEDARALLREHIAWCNGKLAEFGLVADLADNQTGLDEDEEADADADDEVAA